MTAERSPSNKRLTQCGRLASPRQDDPISGEQLHAMANKIVQSAPALRYPELCELVMGISRTPVAGDEDKGERLAAAVAIRDAVPGSHMDNSRLTTAFDAEDD